MGQSGGCLAVSPAVRGGAPQVSHHICCCCDHLFIHTASLKAHQHQSERCMRRTGWSGHAACCAGRTAPRHAKRRPGAQDRVPWGRQVQLMWCSAAVRTIYAAHHAALRAACTHLCRKCTTQRCAMRQSASHQAAGHLQYEGGRREGNSPGALHVHLQCTATPAKSSKHCMHVTCWCQNRNLAARRCHLHSHLTARHPAAQL